MKRLFSLLIVFSLLLTFAIPVMAEEDPIAVTTSAELGTEITIYHTNDTHSRVVEDSYTGNIGFAKIAAIVKADEAAGKNVLLLDAGDSLHGLAIATLSKGESIVDIFNAVGVDAMVPGNHDFNYGQNRLVELAGMMDFSIVSANVIKADDTTLLEPYTIKEIDGIKVGIFGLTSPETTYKTNPTNVTGLTFEDPTTVAQAMVDELTPLVDVIICLGHIGNEGLYSSEAIVTAVDGIDVFVDGHSHSVYDGGLTVNDTLIVQTGDYDKNLGKVTLTYLDGVVTAVATLISNEDAADVVPDPDVLALIETIQAENEVITSVVVSSTSVELDGLRGNVRTGQTNLGNLIAESMLAETGADVAVTNGGGIRASIEVGDITKGDVITVLPFGNYVVTLNVTGADIKSILEVGISDYPEAKGAFPHIAGMSFTFDQTKAAGSRIVSLKIGGVDVVDTETYLLATNDFLAVGGDGYTALEDKAIVNEYSGLDEVVINYINANGTDAAKVDDRIVAIEPVVEAPDVTYTVVSGDVLWRIAKKYDTTWEILAEYNELVNAHLIFPGDVIMIP